MATEIERTTGSAAGARISARWKRRLRRNLTGYAFISPWIIGLFVFRAYPLLASFFFSFTDYDVLNPAVVVGTENYVNMVTKDPVFWKSVNNTLYFVALVVPLGLVSSLGLAMLLNLRSTGIGLYRTIYYLPSIVPPVAGTLIFLVMLHPADGMVNTLLRGIGVNRPPGWFHSATWSKPGLILLSLWGAGTSTLVFLAGLQDIPEALYDAAKIDGASAWQRFLKVTLPLLTPVILFNLIMGIIGSFGVFTSAVVAGSASSTGVGQGTGGTTSGGPLGSMLMYMMLLYRYAFRYFSMGYASAMAVTMFVVILVLTLILLKTSRSWVYYEVASHR
jgi:multiple sugar transport system permease protein